MQEFVEASGGMKEWDIARAPLTRVQLFLGTTTIELSKSLQEQETDILPREIELRFDRLGTLSPLPDRIEPCVYGSIGGFDAWNVFL